MDQEPDVTCDPKATCSAAHRNSGERVRVDLKDSIWSYRKHGCVHTGCSFELTRSTTSGEKKLTQRGLGASNASARSREIQL